VGDLLARLPEYPGSLMLASALNRLLAPHLPADVCALLSGKHLRIQVRDARLVFNFTCTDGRFVAQARQPRADLIISASAQDFLRLARRQEDPDTLFFSRRLSMEGDTELGLVVKNTLDALDLPVFDWEHWKPARVLARLGPAHSGTAQRHDPGAPGLAVAKNHGARRPECPE